MNSNDNRDEISHRKGEAAAEPLREGMRHSTLASGHISRRTCVCGRPQALARRGRRWHRLGACPHCLRSASPSPAANVPPKGDQDAKE